MEIKANMADTENQVQAAGAANQTYHVAKKQFYNASDIAARMQVSQSMAYKIIRKLNAELKAKGYITVSGKVSRSYFECRLCEAPAEA